MPEARQNSARAIVVIVAEPMHLGQPAFRQAGGDVKVCCTIYYVTLNFHAGNEFLTKLSVFECN